MDISKLPKWAQKHINELERQRDIAVQSLEDWTNSQEKAPFHISEYVSTTTPPTSMVRYIQAKTIGFDYAGVEGSITLYGGDIRISLFKGQVSILPSAANSFLIKIA